MLHDIWLLVPDIKNQITDCLTRSYFKATNNFLLFSFLFHATQVVTLKEILLLQNQKVQKEWKKETRNKNIWFFGGNNQVEAVKKTKLHRKKKQKKLLDSNQAPWLIVVVSCFSTCMKISFEILEKSFRYNKQRWCRLCWINQKAIKWRTNFMGRNCWLQAPFQRWHHQ